MKVFSKFLVALIGGYFGILQSLKDAEDVNLYELDKRELSRRLRHNDLRPFFFSLADFLITQSAETVELRQAKGRSRTPSPTKKAKLTEGNELGEINLSDELPPEPPAIYISSKVQSTPEPKKRVFSGESYGSTSTETSPARINHLEPHTQALQNDLIKSLINDVWGGASVSWAQNREMYLDYRPYLNEEMQSNDSSFSTSFRCRLHGNDGTSDDRIIAQPDGALVLITSKKSNPKKRVIWSLQEAALAFEVVRLIVRLIVGQTSRRKVGGGIDGQRFQTKPTQRSTQPPHKSGQKCWDLYVIQNTTISELKRSYLSIITLTVGIYRTLRGLSRVYLLRDLSRGLSFHNPKRRITRSEIEIQRPTSSLSHRAMQFTSS